MRCGAPSFRDASRRAQQNRRRSRTIKDAIIEYLADAAEEEREALAKMETRLVEVE
jgi:metal-responsive CopG/Arc/MetJ family transcriptional regulator